MLLLVVPVTVSFLHIIAYLLQESVQLQHIPLYIEQTNLQACLLRAENLKILKFLRCL